MLNFVASHPAFIAFVSARGCSFQAVSQPRELLSALRTHCGSRITETASHLASVLLLHPFTLLHSQLQCVPLGNKPYLKAPLLTIYIGFASLLEEDHRFCQSVRVRLIRGACSHSELVPPC